MIAEFLMTLATATASGYAIFELVELVPWYWFGSLSDPLPLRDRLSAVLVGVAVVAAIAPPSDLPKIALLAAGFTIGVVCNTISPLRNIARKD
jgi:hypothetical protein